MDGDKRMESTGIVNRIKQIMEESSWSEYKLAKESGLSQSTVSHLLKRNNAPNFTTVEAICRAFSITLAQFFSEEGEAIVLTEEQRKHLLQWGQMSDEQKAIITSTVAQFIAD